mgnify:CR=1 FL=1
MGLNLDDVLVRGKIDLDIWKGYEHGWVEFSFKGTTYVFDSMIKGITPQKEYYKKYKPEKWFEATQKEILDKYLTEEYAIEIKKGLWQFKNIIDNEMCNGYVLNALRLSRIEISTLDENEHYPVFSKIFQIDTNEKVNRFIAYDEPSG